MNVLIVGCGKMGGALLTQWQKPGDHRFVVADPALSDAPEGAELVAGPQALAGEAFDCLIVAIKPQLVDKVLPDYAAHLSETGLTASIAAGCSVARLQAAIGKRPVVRIMPNMPSAIGAGVSGLFAGPGVTASHRQAIDELMSRAGIAIWVDDEDKLDRVTAIAGSGPGYVFEMARAYCEAAEGLGFSPDEARNLVLGTMAGTIEMARQTGTPLDALRNAVTSKNGTTEAGLAALNGDGRFTDLIRGAADAAYARAVELR